MSSLKSATRSWGFDFIPANFGSREASRNNSIAGPSTHEMDSSGSGRVSRAASGLHLPALGADQCGETMKSDVETGESGAEGGMKMRKRSSVGVS